MAKRETEMEMKETLSEIKDGRVNRMLGFIIHSRVESRERGYS